MNNPNQTLLPPPAAPREETGGGIELAAAFRFLRRRVTLIAGTGLLVAGLSYLLVSQLSPRYTAEALLMLDARTVHVTDAVQVLSGLPADNTVLRTELDVLHSPPLMDRVAERLDLYSEAALARPASSGRWTQLRAWLDEQLPKVLPDRLLRAWADAGEAAQEAPFDPAVMRRRILYSLLEGLETDNDGRSNTIRLRFTSPDPLLSADVVNTLADQYIADQLDTKAEATRQVSRWLLQRIEELRLEVRNAEMAVRDYRDRHDMIESRGETLNEQQLADINAQLVVAQVERSQAESRLHAARNGSPAGLRDVEGATILWQLRSEESGLRRRQAELSSRYGQRHPEMLNLAAERAEIQEKIREESGRVIQSLSLAVQEAHAKEQALAEALSGLRQRSGGAERAEVELNELIRNAESASALYASFLQRYRETSEQEGLQRSDARIIATADAPENPSFPRPALMTGVGGVLGLLLGFLLAAVREMVDRGYRLSRQVEQETGLPVLMVEPMLKTRLEPSAYAISKPFSAFTEGLRGLRTGLQFARPDSPHKVVMVTSSVPSEGKTSLCLSLGRMAARAGARTLIIEADMRRPRMAQRLKLRAKAHLVDVLDGSKSLDDAIVEDRLSGLHVVTSRGGVASPVEVLASRRMASFLQAMRLHYDLVILDTPPVMAVADASALGKAVDAVVFVVRWGETPRETVKAALRQLSLMDVPVTGIALSQVDLRRQASYGFGDYGYCYSRYRSYYTE